MKRPITVGLAGCGQIGAEHLRAWREVAAAAPASVQIAAVGDCRAAAAHRAADEVRAWQDRRPRVFTSVEQMLHDTQLDAVDVCLPVADHEPVTVQALRQGLHVLVEKPLATTVAGGRAMVAAAAEAGRVLALAENHRRAMPIRIARWLLDQQAIGAPELLLAQRSRYQPPAPLQPPAGRTGVPQPQWRASRRLSGGGWAIDNAAHLLDTWQYLFGPIAAVTATAKRITDRIVPHPDGTAVIDEREDLLAALVRFEGGTTAIFSCASALPGAENFCSTIQGTLGAIVDPGEAGSGQLFHTPLITAQLRVPGHPPRTLGEFQREFLTSLGHDERRRMFPHHLENEFAIECAEFADAIRHGTPVEITGTDALVTLATSLAFYESAMTLATVTVEAVLSGQVTAYQDTIQPPNPRQESKLEGDFAVYRTQWPPPSAPPSVRRPAASGDQR